MKPIRPTGPMRGNLNIVERAGNHVDCVSEIAGDKANFAVDSVGPPTMAIGVKIKDTPAWARLKYRAANGTAIDNQGEKVIQAITKQGKNIGMTFQIANVTKPLGSVRAMLDAGNKVIF